MADIQIWFADDNDMVVEVADLIDSLTSAFVNDATVQATLKDDQGVEVVGQTWPINVPYSGTDGLYQVIVDKAVQVLDGVGYVLFITASSPGGLDAEWQVQIGGKTRV